MRSERYELGYTNHARGKSTGGMFVYPPSSDGPPQLLYRRGDLSVVSPQIINDNMMYAKVVVRMGVRTECKNCDFSDIMEDEDVSLAY